MCRRFSIKYIGIKKCTHFETVPKMCGIRCGRMPKTRILVAISYKGVQRGQPSCCRQYSKSANKFLLSITKLTTTMTTTGNTATTTSTTTTNWNVPHSPSLCVSFAEEWITATNHAVIEGSCRETQHWSAGGHNVANSYALIKPKIIVTNCNYMVRWIGKLLSQGQRKLFSLPA